MNLHKCIMTHSTCYNGTSRGIPVGVLWHDTNGGNPYVKRYVQPYEGDANYAEMIALLGKNPNGNDWNHTNRQAGVNAFIGKLASGRVGSVQTLDWTQRPWGVGKGLRGSLNGSPYVSNSPFWIQFEICDDGYKSADYLAAVYNEAVELTAYLCKLCNINPAGTYTYNGVKVPTVTSHFESYTYGLGGCHTDPVSWFNTIGGGYSMNKVRADVLAKYKEMCDMTKDETKKLIGDMLKDALKDYAPKSALEGLATLPDIERAIRENAAATNIPDIGHAPNWAQPELRELLDCGAINGGTAARINPDDINLDLDTIKAALINKRYTDAALSKLEHP